MAEIVDVLADHSHAVVRAGAAGNHLLGSLGRRQIMALETAGDLVEVNARERLGVAGDAIRHVYFPTGGYAALMVSGKDGARMQVAPVGTEGMLGFEAILDGQRQAFDICVPEALWALRLDVEQFAKQLSGWQAWRALLMKDLARLIDVIARNVLCARYHVLEARLARCLLEIHDRHCEQPIQLTQSALARLLGVRRSGVTNAATHLQLLGLIHYRRGEIRVLDRRGLEAVVCDCYRGNVH